jgi:hypothetical protein
VAFQNLVALGLFLFAATFLWLPAAWPAGPGAERNSVHADERARLRRRDRLRDRGVGRFQAVLVGGRPRLCPASPGWLLSSPSARSSTSALAPGPASATTLPPLPRRSRSSPSRGCAIAMTTARPAPVPAPGPQTPALRRRLHRPAGRPRRKAATGLYTRLSGRRLTEELETDPRLSALTPGPRRKHVVRAGHRSW